MDRGGGGQVVSALTLYSNGLSSNPGEVYSVFSILFEKDENIRKEANYKKVLSQNFNPAASLLNVFHSI